MISPFEHPLPEAQLALLPYFVFRDDNIARYHAPGRPFDWELARATFRAFGARWKRGEGFVFPRGSDGPALVAATLATGVVADPARIAAFETPRDLARRMAALARITPGQIVLEPSAGTGALAEAAHERGGLVTCVEPNAALAERLVGRFDRVLQARLQDAPLDGERFDAAILHPPIASDEWGDQGHVLDAARRVRFGGTIVAIMGARAKWRHGPAQRAFSEFVNVRAHRWEPLPARTFRAGDVGVPMSLLVVTR
jgi:hypothetical protein